MKYQEHSAGWIEIICGPMFAGKTEELIRRIERMKYAKKNYIVFKPIIDNRYSNTSIVSHSNYKAEAINIERPSEIKKYVNELTQSIIIDEAQFFSKEIIPIIQEYADNGLRIICAGLDTDFKGEPFGIIPELLAIAEKITKLTAICMVCGAEASRTQRIINGVPAFYDDSVVMVGAKEAYEARCRICHKVLIREK